jgi:hypothetical protein
VRLWIPEGSGAVALRERAVFRATLPNLTRVYDTVWGVELWLWRDVEGLVARADLDRLVTMAKVCGIRLVPNERGFYVVED